MIKYLIMDVDRTITDGKIYMGDNGEVMKAFSIKDGYGIHDILIPKGITPIVITGRKSSIVENRCHELGIDKLYQCVSDKCSLINQIISDLSECAYIGDDLNDFDAMIQIKNCGGILGCPKNASKNIKDISDFISSNNGGDGAARDFIDYLIVCNYI